MAASEIDIIKKHSERLATEEKLALIDFLAKSLHRSSHQAAPLEFGKYSETSSRMSTIEDFQIAEWHPADLELNGN